MPYNCMFKVKSSIKHLFFFINHQQLSFISFFSRKSAENIAPGDLG